MIILQNPGVLEIDLITTMGANVKETANAIGQFGTGLKYAIACLLREGIEFELFLGTNKYEFHVEEKDLRGKRFGLCYMRSKYDSVALGFTTELGFGWKQWQAYRELFTNCVLDEDGCVYHIDDLEDNCIPPLEEHTTFIIKSPIDTHEVFLCELTKEKLFENDHVQIFKGQTKYLYYQGIRAKELNKPSLYTYNIKHGCELTEDRSIAYDFQVSRTLAEAVIDMTSEHSELIVDIIGAGKEYFESRIDFSEAYKAPVELFTDSLKQVKITDRNPTIDIYLKKHEPTKERTRREILKDFTLEVKQLCAFYDVSLLLDEGEFRLVDKDLTF